MQKSWARAVALFLFSILIMNPVHAAGPTLIVATYDSIVAKGGLGPELFELFEKKCGCRVQALASGDGAQLLSKLQLDSERGKPQAHVVLGLDQRVWERAKPFLEEWGSWLPKGYDRIPRAQRLEPGFLPFDYGVFAFMVDREALKAAHLAEPRKLSDLLKPEWRRQVILEDPRTSTPGQAFVLYADAVGGEGFWGKFKTQWLTLAPGWDAAYGLFLKKEAPLVWSYTTSQAYHEAHGDRAGRYRALVFEEGNPMQLEGAALVKGAFDAKDSASAVEIAQADQLRRQAQAFLEFLLTPEAQALVPSKNWMLPVLPKTKLPESFSRLPKARKIVVLPTEPKKVEAELAQWKQAIGSGR